MCNDHIDTFHSTDHLHCDAFKAWLNATKKEKARHISVLLESLEHKNTEIRFTNARRLFYILQGWEALARFSLRRQASRVLARKLQGNKLPRTPTPVYT